MFRKIALPIVVVGLLTLAVAEIYAMRQTYLGGSYSSYGTYGTYYPHYQQVSPAEDPNGCLTREDVSENRRKEGNFCLSALQGTDSPVNTLGVRLSAFTSNLEQATGLRWWVLGLMALAALFLVVLAFLGGLIIGRRRTASATLPSSSGKVLRVQKPLPLW